MSPAIPARRLAALSVTIDTNAPLVDETTAVPSNGTEFPGDTIVVTLNLNEVVAVAGTPTLALNSGGTATYSGGSGTDTLTFIYTVGANDSTVPALTITAVNLPDGATISDAAGNTADLSGALVTFPDLQIDPPSTPVITSFSTDSGTAGDRITNDNTLTLTGTATANSTVTVYDGANIARNHHKRCQRRLELYHRGANRRRPQFHCDGNGGRQHRRGIRGAERHHRHQRRRSPRRLPRSRPTAARLATASPMTIP